MTFSGTQAFDNSILPPQTFSEYVTMSWVLEELLKICDQYTNAGFENRAQQQTTFRGDFGENIRRSYDPFAQG